MQLWSLINVGIYFSCVCVFAVSLGVFGIGVNFVFGLANRDHAIVGNKSCLVELKNSISELENKFETKLEKLNETVIRMDKQLFAISINLNVAIIAAEND